MREYTETKIDKTLAAGAIEPATSDLVSLVVFTRKKDGTSRLCVDYRRLST